jgi:hypothetical protein
MSPLSVSPRDRVLLAALLGLALGGTLAISRLGPKERSGSPLEQPSTFFSADYGTKAAYTALGRLGYTTERIRKPLGPRNLVGIRTLFVLGPLLPLDRGEERALLDWVHAGHVLVLAPGRMTKFPNLLDRASLEGTPAPGNATLDHDESWLEGAHRLSMSLTLRETLGGPAKGALEHAETIHFWKDERGTLGLRMTHGSGFVVALADASPLSNRGLREADNALLLAGLARLAGARDVTGGVAFDEYHLGFDDHDATPVALVKLVMTERFRPGMLQALFVLFLGLVAAAWRFGNPRERTTARRRQHGEFAEAAGALLLEAGAGPLVKNKLLSHYRAWAVGHTGLPPTIDDRALDAELGRRAGLDIGALLTECRGAPVSSPSPKDVLRTSRVLYRVRKALSDGTR